MRLHHLHQTHIKSFQVKTVLTVLLGLIAGGANASQPGDLNNRQGYPSPDYCAQTTRAAYTSCVHERQEEYWIGWGACTNVEDSSDRAACYEENRLGRVEAGHQCADDRAGRRDVCDLLGESRYDPEYEPEDFVDPSDIGGSVDPNPYFPLVPGNRWVYEADGEVITVEVLDETKVVDGVLCAVVRDIVIETEAEEDDGENFLLEEGEGEGGLPVEDTFDWYAQDLAGNVWYFGEISLNYEEGELVNIDGSWKAGEDEASPGILMFSMPAVDSTYRQEFLLGEAEDLAMVINLNAQPELGEGNVGDCSLGCLQTEEWTPLDTESTEYKYYQPGVGMVLETKPDSDERVELVEFESAD